jgi:hypothetical protein
MALRRSRWNAANDTQPHLANRIIFRFKAWWGEPFSVGAMTPISNVDPSSVSGQFAIAVQKKVNDAEADQGQAELQLIDTAAPQKATSGSVGTQLHIVA